MNIVPSIFYFFATLTVLFALMVILSPNPVRGALFLVATFLTSAVMWLLLEAEFLGLVLILVYVGAVMTLFLFVVMMLNLDVVPFKQGFVSYVPIALLVILAIFVMLFYGVGPSQFGLSQVAEPVVQAAHYSNTKALGLVLYTDFVYPFEVAGVILLVAIIAAISLAFRGRMNRLSQRPSDQMNVNPKDRVRLVNMPSEKKI